MSCLAGAIGVFADAGTFKGGFCVRPKKNNLRLHNSGVPSKMKHNSRTAPLGIPRTASYSYYSFAALPAG
jgi:hypothetical protein